MERKKKILSLYQVLREKYGDLVVLGSELDVSRDRVPFGVSEFDAIIGGGVPVSTLVELFGAEGIGKTTFAYCLAASAQKYGTVLYVDLEGQWRADWAEEHGVDPSRIVLVRPVNAEAALNAVLEGVKGNTPLIVVDSVSAMESSAAFAREIDEPLVGQIPLLLNRVLRRVIVFQRRSRSIVLFLNQLRERVSLGRPLYGDAYVTPGGRGLRHFTHLRLYVERVRYVTDSKKNRVGHLIGITVVKSKVSRPYQKCTVRLDYEKGIVGRS